MRFSTPLVSLAVVALQLIGVAHAAVIPGLVARTGSSASECGSADVCACIFGAVKVSGTDWGSLSIPFTTGLIVSLTGMINATGHKKSCILPKNSKSNCWRKDLCDFTCNSGFIALGAICAAENLAKRIAASIGI
ncbi:hypothetical protein FB451DRAFT_1410906 [Mycena latifolia]|nr:hypothetical protein FB451DRAFT_1410906 [Mycena latifolia]